MKRFFEWIGVKEKLHLAESKVPHVNEAEVWWASLGENVGFEINGKSGLFTRPVLIFKKLSREFYLVVPLTTQKHMGSWYVNFELNGKVQSACLHQIRALDYRHFFPNSVSSVLRIIRRSKVAFMTFVYKNILRYF